MSKNENKRLVVAAAVVLAAQITIAADEKCGQDLICRFGSGFEKNSEAVDFINKKVEAKTKARLKSNAEIELQSLDSPFVVGVTYVLTKSIEFRGNKLPKGARLVFLVYKNEVELTTIRLQGGSFAWGALEPSGLVHFCKWQPMFGKIRAGKTIAGLKAIDGFVSVFFYSDGKIKGAEAKTGAKFEYQSHVYTDKDGIIVFKKNGDPFTKNEEQKLIAENKDPFDREDERDWTCLDKQLDYVPDDKHFSYMDEFGKGN